MADEIKVFIENVNFVPMELSVKDKFLIIAPGFCAYRAAGKTETDAYLATLKDLNWLAAHVQDVPSKQS